MLVERYDSGAFREVEIYEDYVVKTLVDLNAEREDAEEEFEEENYANENEIKIYRDFGEKYHVLCPIELEESDATWLKMRRAKCWDGNSEEYGDQVEDLVECFLSSKSEEKLKLSPIEVAAAVVDFRAQMEEIYWDNRELYNYLTDDLSPRNTGILDKHLVILDYGGCGDKW